MNKEKKSSIESQIRLWEATKSKARNKSQLEWCQTQIDILKELIENAND